MGKLMIARRAASPAKSVRLSMARTRFCTLGSGIEAANDRVQFPQIVRSLAGRIAVTQYKVAPTSRRDFYIRSLKPPNFKPSSNFSAAMGLSFDFAFSEDARQGAPTDRPHAALMAGASASTLNPTNAAPIPRSQR